MRNDATKTSFLRTNATILSVAGCYAVCLAAVLVLGGEATLLKIVMGGLGFLAAVAYGLVWLVRLARVIRESRGALTLARIAEVLKGMGIPAEVISEDRVRFAYKFGNIGWVLRYCAEEGRMSIGIAMPMDDPSNAEIAQKGGNEVMSKHKMVRLFLRTHEEKTIFLLTVEMFITSLSDFRKFIGRYLDMMVEAMQEHDSICCKLAEERSHPKPSNRIGFVSPMQEKIRAFDKMNPNATEAERNQFIENLRKQPPSNRPAV